MFDRTSFLRKGHEIGGLWLVFFALAINLIFPEIYEPILNFLFGKDPSFFTPSYRLVSAYSVAIAINLLNMILWQRGSGPFRYVLVLFVFLNIIALAFFGVVGFVKAIPMMQLLVNTFININCKLGVM